MAAFSGGIDDVSFKVKGLFSAVKLGHQRKHVSGKAVPGSVVKNQLQEISEVSGNKQVCHARSGKDLFTEAGPAQAFKVDYLFVWPVCIRVRETADRVSCVYWGEGSDLHCTVVTVSEQLRNTVFHEISKGLEAGIRHL